MIVQFRYFTWSPPNLTDEEELELGWQIAVQGREHFVAEFHKSIAQSKGQPERPPATPLKIIFGILFFIGCFWAIISSGMFPQFAVLAVIGTGVILVSFYITTRKFEKWIDRLVAKYAAHAGRGGK